MAKYVLLMSFFHIFFGAKVYFQEARSSAQWTVDGRQHCNMRVNICIWAVSCVHSHRHTFLSHYNRTFKITLEMITMIMISFCAASHSQHSLSRCVSSWYTGTIAQHLVKCNLNYKGFTWMQQRLTTAYIFIQTTFLLLIKSRKYRLDYKVRCPFITFYFNNNFKHFNIRYK